MEQQSHSPSSQPSRLFEKTTTVFMSDSQTALRCAQFFFTLSENCFTLSKTLKNSQSDGNRKQPSMDMKKTKQIMKQKAKIYKVKSRNTRSQSDSQIQDLGNGSCEKDPVKEKLKKLITEKSNRRRQKEWLAKKKQVKLKNSDTKYSQKNKLKRQQRQKNRNIMKQACLKRPIPAYIFYYRDKYKTFSQKFPGMKINDLTKLIAESWNNIDQIQKRPYLLQSIQARKDYQMKKNQLFRKDKNNQSIQNLNGKRQTELNKDEINEFSMQEEKKAQEDSENDISQNSINQDLEQQVISELSEQSSSLDEQNEYQKNGQLR